MGYMSKIRIGTTIKNLGLIKEYVRDKLGENSLNNYMEDYEVFAKKEDIVFIGWDWINFSNRRPDVEAIYEALAIMEKKELPYRMAIVGEDYVEYGAIEIIDADPFDLIPHIYTEIDFVYDF